MRRAVSGVVVFLMIFAGISAAEEIPHLAGAGALVSTRPYHGTGVQAVPVPFIVWDYKGFFIQGKEIGYKFYDQKGLSLAALGQGRFMGYHSSDSDSLNRMEDRKMSMDAGVKAAYDLPWGSGWSVGGKIVNDVLSRYDGREAELSVNKEVRSDFFRLKLSAGTRVLSSQLTNYYYGVRSGEAVSGRAAYTPGYAVDPFMGVVLTTGFSKDWLAVVRTGVEFLADNICKSPLVKDTYILDGAIGIVRRF